MITREYFEKLKTHLFDQRKHGEHYFLGFSGETSQFIRLNGGKIRQTGTIENASLDLNFVRESKPGHRQRAGQSITLTGVPALDLENLERMTERLRTETEQLPRDPFVELPKNTGSSLTETKGQILAPESTPDALLSQAQDLDIAGIYAGGTMTRAMANTAGQSHWFSTQTFSLDYSIYTPEQRAVKGTYAGTKWEQAQFEASLAQAKSQLEILHRPSKKLKPDTYRTYLAPAALGDLVHMFSWGGVSESAIRQGESPLRLCRSGERQFSPLFTLSEDYRGGEVPRFNALGELAPEHLDLIASGKLTHTLISSRTALEYQLTSNGAQESEGLHSPSVSPGGLDESKILSTLDTGLYLSNLHYLNWSDQAGGRVTGMTRYACFWVEGGKVIAPIENLRFDDSLFDLLGSELLDLTTSRSYLADTGSYEWRSLGGSWVPGALVRGMKFTL